MHRIIVFYKNIDNKWGMLDKKIKRDPLIFQREDPINWVKLRFYCYVDKGKLEESLNKFYNDIKESPLIKENDINQIKWLIKNKLKKFNVTNKGNNKS